MSEQAPPGPPEPPGSPGAPGPATATEQKEKSGRFTPGAGNGGNVIKNPPVPPIKTD